MTEPLDTHEALRLVPGWDATRAEIEKLSGGLTNRSYRIRYRGDDFVLRLESDQSSAFRLDRSRESLILKCAHAAELGPELVFSDPDRGVLLVEYLPGRAWQEGDLESTAQLERLAALIRRVHEMPLSEFPIGLADDAKYYAARLGKTHDLQSFARRCEEVVRSVPVSASVVCSHNDVVAGNIIENDGLKLIDWEYASDSHPMYDLACTIGYHDLSRTQAEVLLGAYTGSSGSDWREQLSEQLRVFDAIQWLWLATRQQIVASSQQAKRLEALRNRITNCYATPGV